MKFSMSIEWNSGTLHLLSSRGSSLRLLKNERDESGGDNESRAKNRRRRKESPKKAKTVHVHGPPGTEGTIGNNKIRRSRRDKATSRRLASLRGESAGKNASIKRRTGRCPLETYHRPRRPTLRAESCTEIRVPSPV